MNKRIFRRFVSWIRHMPLSPNVWFFLGALLIGPWALAQMKDPGELQPRRGIAPTGFYAVDQLETINPVTGGVFLNIPLVSMPRNRGDGPRFDLSLTYNNSHWNPRYEKINEETNEGYYVLDPIPGAGWRYNFQYSLELEVKENFMSHYCTAPGDTYKVFKLTLVLPDGSRHLLVNQDLNDTQYNIDNDEPGGYFAIDPVGHIGCTSNKQRLDENVHYHTIDGTFLNVEVDRSTCPRIGESGWLACVEARPWNLYFPDGSVWHQSGFAPSSGITVPQQCNPAIAGYNCPAAGSMVDRTQNSYSTSYNYNNGAWTVNISDQGERQINIVSNPGSADIITTQGVNGESLQWMVNWTIVQGQEIAYLNNSPMGGFSRVMPYDNVVASIVLPSQYCGTGSPGCGLQYTFTYDTANGGNGINNLRSITTPFGSTSTYNYLTDNAASEDRSIWEIIEGRIVQKTKQFNSSYNPPSETTAYALCSSTTLLPWHNCAEITNPDGGITRFYYYTVGPSILGRSDFREGLIWKIQYPNGETSERYWNSNIPVGDPAGYEIYRNPYIKTEYVTLNGRTKATDYAYDANGNVTSKAEYNWVQGVSIPRDSAGAPNGMGSGFGSAVRTTLMAYLYGTANPCSGASYPYWSSPIQVFRSAVCAQEVRSGNASGALISRKEYSYSAVNTAWQSVKLIQERSWSSAKASLGSCNLPSACLNWTNAAITDYSYDSYGNLISLTEPGLSGGLRPQHTFQYDLGGINLISSTAAYGTSLARTTTYSNDDYTGLPLTVTDPNGISTITAYDAVGRPILVREAAGSGVERQTATTYALGYRCVKVQADLNAAADKALTSLQHYDGLGRIWLSQQIEDGSNPSCSDTTSGIKTETRYGHTSTSRVQLVSNPYRSTSDATAGWTRTAFDAMGRAIQVGHFSGGNAPAWDNNNPDNGKVTMTYDWGDPYSSRIYDTVSDEKSLRWNFHDGLGRLLEVREIDPGSAFIYPTQYAYDGLDNLTSVTQQGLLGTYCGGNLVTRCFSYDSLGRLSDAKNPESGTNSYQYDDNGNLTQRILGMDGANPATATMTYDALNRILSKSYSGSGSSTPAVKYCYDGQAYNGSETCTTGLIAGKIGQLTEVHNSVSTTSYSSFDALGRVTASTQTTGGTTYGFSYGYNRAGLSSVTYPSLRTVNYTYDAAGRISGVGGTKNYAGSAVDPAYPIAYGPHGAITSMKMRNGLIESRSYNSRLQAWGITVGINTDLDSLFGMGLYYCPNYNLTCANNNGNVQTILLPNQTQQYGYDGANRLVSMQEGSAQQSWAYDNLGNRWLTSSSGLPQSALLPTSALGYNEKNQLTVQGALYDGRGNQTGIDGNSYTYDGENRLATVNGVNNYEYDGDGRRVRKTAGGVTTTYVYDAMGEMAAEYGTAAVTGGCSPCYVTADHLGSTRLLTNASGNMMERHDYMPFGEELFAGYSSRTTEQGFPSSPLTNKADMLFAGKERDNESGLDYFGARYFSAAQGRFLSVDPENAGAKHEDPQSWNGYAYSRNNPLVYIDPDGKTYNMVTDDAFQWMTIDDSTFNNYYWGRYRFRYGSNLSSGSFEMDKHTWKYSHVENVPLFLLEAIYKWQMAGNAIAELSQWFDRHPEAALALTAGMVALTPEGAGITEKAEQELESEADGIFEILTRIGTKITGFTKHGLNRAIGDGMERAGTKEAAILDALKNPIKTTKGLDQLGRPFEMYIGKMARVIVNPQTGKIVSTNPISGAGAK